MTVIVDKELCLTVEIKDDDNEYDSTVEVLGLATYSNSESTVLSYASMFETLWIQAELKSKKKVAYFLAKGSQYGNSCQILMDILSLRKRLR